MELKTHLNKGEVITIVDLKPVLSEIDRVAEEHLGTDNLDVVLEINNKLELVVKHRPSTSPRVVH
jgi:hypothetical protein